LSIEIMTTPGSSGPAAAVRHHAIVPCPFCATLNRVDLARLADRPRCGGCKRPILLDRPIAVTDGTVERVISGTDVPVVMDGYADWCGPCKIMAPILDDFARDRAGDVLVIKLDTDRNPQTTQRLGIRAIPTLIVFRNGRETGRQAGVTSRDQLDALVSAAAHA
jgi:thioredoxin 2